MKIPKIIHFVWVGDNPLPDFNKGLIDGWRLKHPEWEIKIWDNQTLTEDNFDNLKKINESKNPAQKADIMRYEIIYKYGGVYLDSDMVCVNELDPLFNDDQNMYVCNEDHNIKKYCSIGFFAAIPHHLIFKKCIDEIKNMKANTRAVNAVSGPSYFRKCFVNSDYKIVPTEMFYPVHLKQKKRIIESKLEELKKEFSGSYAIHLWGDTWRLFNKKNP